MSRPYILLGLELSHFTGKARSYLEHKRVPFVELLDAHIAKTGQREGRVSRSLEHRRRWACSTARTDGRR